MGLLRCMSQNGTTEKSNPVQRLCPELRGFCFARAGGMALGGPQPTCLTLVVCAAPLTDGSRASRGIGVRRREFIVLAGGVATWPLAVRAQRPAMPVIGYFSARSPDAEVPIRIPFLKALEGLGFAIGRDIAIEYRFAEGQDERLPGMAAELVRREVAILVATDRP